MLGGPIGAYKVHNKMIGGVNPTVEKFRMILSVVLVSATKRTTTILPLCLHSRMVSR